MLNPEIIKEFGEDSELFFTTLREDIGDDLLDKCYTVTDLRVSSGRLHAPRWLGILTNDEDILDIIQDRCVEISIDLSEDNDPNEPLVGCMIRSEEKLKEGGIKVWV